MPGGALARLSPALPAPLFMHGQALSPRWSHTPSVADQTAAARRTPWPATPRPPTANAKSGKAAGSGTFPVIPVGIVMSVRPETTSLAWIAQRTAKSLPRSVARVECRKSVIVKCQQPHAKRGACRAFGGHHHAGIQEGSLACRVVLDWLVVAKCHILHDARRRTIETSTILV